MDKNTPVSHLMTKQVIVADLKTKFDNILKLFLDYNIYHLPVVFDDKIIGIVSMTDALNYYRNGGTAEDFDIEKIMTHNPRTISPETSLKEVTELLANANFRTLPIAEEGRLVGIISNKDLVRVLKAKL